MSRVFKLRVPGDPSTTFAPLRTANYKLSTTGYATFVNEATDVTATEMVFTGSKSNLRRMDAVESNVSKLFVMLRSLFGGDTDSLNLALNANSATRLVNTRSFSLSGDASSSGVNFDGQANATIPVTLANTGVTTGTYLKVSVDAKGRVLLGLPMTATDVTNALGYTPAQSGTGSVETANRLTTARNFQINGGDAVAGSTISFDGTANVALPLTLTNTGVTAGTYNRVVVDAKGRVLSGQNLAYLTTESDTLATVTARGATTATAISLTNTTNSTSASTGALVVTGGVGVGTNMWVGGTTVTANLTARGNIRLEAMTNAGSTGSVVFGRSDGTLREHAITVSNNTGQLNNWMSFNLHTGGTLGAQTEVLRLFGNASASFLGAVSVNGNLSVVGDQSIGGNLSVTGTASGQDPTADTHFVTRRWADDIPSKRSVRVASTANVDLTLPGSSLGGVTLVPGNRILLKDQTQPSQNGIYVFNGEATPLTRATDADLWTNLVGSVVGIEEGSVNANTAWFCTSDSGGTLGVADNLFPNSSLDATSGNTPTGYNIAQNDSGLTYTWGPITVMDGIPGRVLRLQGTTNLSATRPQFAAIPIKVASTPHTASAFVAFMPGSVFTGISSIRLRMLAASNVVSSIPLVADGVVARYQVTANSRATLPDTVTYQFEFNYATGSTIDVLMWVGWPQLEIGSVATAANPTPVTWQLVSNPLLASMGASASNGLIARTGPTTSAPRTITGSTDIWVGNGDGVSGDPTITLTDTGVVAGTYNRVVVNAKGRITGGATTSDVTRVVDAFTGNNVTTSFNLSRAPGGPNDVIVSMGGVIQRPTVDYAITGSTLTFVDVPQSGTPIWVLHLGPAADIVAPSLSRTVNTFTGNGSTTSFTLSMAPGGANDVLASVGGIILTPTTEYSISGTTITFSTAPATGTPIWVMILGVTQVVTGVSTGSTATVTARWNFWGGMDVDNNIQPRLNTEVDVGAPGRRFRAVYADLFDGQATTAQMADVAERYAADDVYAPGTVVVFGGTNEITISTVAYDHRVAGVISTAPAYMMNSKAGSDATHPYVGLIGRLPCKVVGPVRKGDLLVVSDVPGHAMAADMDENLTYRVIGKALEDKIGSDAGVIEIALVRA